MHCCASAIPTATREHVASADLALRFESLWFDFRFALRQLRRSPGFAFTAVLTLALAIGANAVVFSVLNSLILRPLNVPHPESLYAIFNHGDAGESYPNYLDLRDRNHSFDSLAAYNIYQVGLDTGAGTLPNLGLRNHRELLWRIRAGALSRPLFPAYDERGPNSAPYIVLTYTFWQNHFQGNRGVLGQVVQLNKHPFTIIGVARPDFHGTLLFFNPDFFVPLVDEEQVQGVNVLDKRNKTAVFMSSAI